MQGQFIDDYGAIWPADPAVVVRRFGDRRIRRNVAVQAVELGYVFICFSEFGARIALRPHLAARSAIFALFGIIANRAPMRIAITCDTRLSSWELISDRWRAIERIEQLMAEAKDPLPQPLLREQHLPLEHCVDITGGQMLPILETWKQRQGRWEPELYGLLQECGLLETTTISQQPLKAERLLIEYWGEGITSYGKNWTRIARGRDFEDQPNSQLGRWDAARQRQLLTGGLPRFSVPDFVFRRPNQELVRVSCYRLGLPWRSAEGTSILTAITTQRRMCILERPKRAN